MDGWVLLHRKMTDHPLWLAEPFTRGQAWVDLIMLARHDSGFFYVRGNKVDVDRAQVAWALESLGKRWKWSRNKVKKFLNDLENEHQISICNTSVIQVITIINYDYFQEKGRQKDIRRTSEGHQKDTNKECRKNE